MFSGKGGVGKTSLAAATGLRLAATGRRTLVLSVDPAHSLADAFDLRSHLFSKMTADPYRVADGLDIQEVDIQTEIRRHWNEVVSYVTSVLRTTGLGTVEAEELAILPGMEEMSALMYVNEYFRANRYDVVVLDCAPTAESLRFVSMPTTLEWYMRHIFPIQRNVLKAVRPIANKVAPFELPPDSYFATVKQLFGRLAGVQLLLEDPAVTSVRLVTNAERVVLRETQRAFVYFSVHGLSVDTVIVNRVLPAAVREPYFAAWHATQDQVIDQMRAYFAPVPLSTVPLLDDEALGIPRLQELARQLYGESVDPSTPQRSERPYSFEKVDGGRYQVRLSLPFATKGEIGLFKKADELVVEIGSLRRHVGLPSSMASLQPARARLSGGTLIIELERPS
jgi:arsenite-transporting ATPase